MTDTAHSSHLVDELVTMRNSGEMFDYVIKGSKESFRIHSLVLATMSPVFRAMMRSDTAESSKKEATFPTIPDVIMSKVIDYAYLGTCTFTRLQLVDLIKASHYFQMVKLLKLCEEQIIAVLGPNNCFSWFNLADQLQLTAALPKIQKMMRTAYRDIIASEEFKLLEVPELVQYLEDVREHDTCSDDLLRGVLEWVTHDEPNRSMNAQELFTLISFGKCSENAILKMMTEHAELLDMQMEVYKLMLSDVLNNVKPKFQLGKDKTVIILGGQTIQDVPNSTSWILREEQFEKYCDMSTGCVINDFHSLCKVPHGMMLTGGDDSDTCLLFVLPMKIWVKQQSMPSKRRNHGSGYTCGKVFVISGLREGVAGYTRSVDVMDFEKQTWYQGPALPTGGNLPKVVPYKSTMFVLFSKERCLYQLNTEAMSWLTKTPLPKASFGCCVASAEEKIFGAGGDNNINYMYTPETDVWCRLTGPSLMERQGALVYFQEKLYLFAGCRKDAQLTDVEEYDIKSDMCVLAKWKFPTPLMLFSAFLVDTPQ